MLRSVTAEEVEVEVEEEEVKVKVKVEEEEEEVVEEVVNEIYPVWTYSYLALLFPVFLATDYLRYKPVLLLQAGGLVATYATLAWARGAAAMQLMEFFFGLATATEVAYYAYIYSVVPAACYQRVTGYCRSATLLGSAAGSLSGQLLVTVASVPLRRLVYATLASAAVAFAAPWFLPTPGRSLFFHPSGAATAAAEEEETTVHDADDAESKVPLNGEQDPRAGPWKDGGGASGGGSSGLAEVLRVLWEDFRRCYARRPLLAWSAWWALSTCGYFQVVNYTQVLWERVRSPHDPTLYNGYVETLSTMLEEELGKRRDEVG
ncbi:hypothetical protein CRUP_010195 [Coryphaenoides rupestris]|nr:hypothetical protein CRUP_010195 [Coryphaenoides rupestris]